MGTRLTVWRLALPASALLLLAAHFVHAGIIAAAAMPVLALGLLAVSRAWAARTLQVVLAVAVIEWLLTGWTLASLRASHGQPYVRLLVILGAVAAFTALAAIVLQSRALRDHFRLGPRAGPVDGAPPAR